jgi:2-keto-4-pentenoate hydratase/2-oxohepta-3-ene-1,7-dioic acid hydratase in catechol pathway
MKIARFEYRNAVLLGIVDTDRGLLDVVRPTTASRDPMIALIESDLAGIAPQGSGETVPLADVRLLPPIAQPSKNILCVGKNYVAHAAEFTRSGYDGTAKSLTDPVPDAPIVFTKAPCSMVGAHDDVLPPWALTTEVDYEAELGVVIGRGGRSIASAEALAHVWGYTVINDVTARDLQVKHKQWLLGKSIDTFCPIGPWLVTADEIDHANTGISCWVNGELRQQANTRDMIFDIPAIIATISASMSLAPGDIIATGTPAGVGVGFKPPKFLQRGDTVRIAIAGIGEISNRIA